jgi:hypothetical protein
VFFLKPKFIPNVWKAVEYRYDYSAQDDEMQDRQVVSLDGMRKYFWPNAYMNR